MGVQLDMEVPNPEAAARATHIAAATAVCESAAGPCSPAEGDGASQREDAGGALPRSGPAPLPGRRDTAEVGTAAAAAQEAAERFSDLSSGKLRTISAPVDRRSVDSLLGPGHRRPPIDRSKAFEAFLSSKQQAPGEDGAGGALPTISETGSLSSRASRECLIHKGTVGAGVLQPDDPVLRPAI